jgi:hypothetical protein
VAFLHGASREKGILNDKLARVTAFSRFYFLLQFGQGCIDQYALKYFASMIGWPIIAVPFLMKTDMPVAEVTTFLDTRLCRLTTRRDGMVLVKQWGLRVRYDGECRWRRGIASLTRSFSPPAAPSATC